MMFTTDCSKEEGMCSLVDAVSLRCLDLSIRNRRPIEINLTHTRRRTITTKLSVDKRLLMNMSEFTLHGHQAHSLSLVCHS